MHSDFLLIDDGSDTVETWRRLPIGDTGGRNEAWLRDGILRAPEILPVQDIDPSFGPLAPLCSELRTEAGPIDAVFLNPEGKLTIVECKLWRNPQARREVVAQTLDYARALKRWSYSDLQRQVSARLKEQGNIPFYRARALQPELDEASFIDAVARNLRSGRFLMVILGDGVREDVEAIAELINSNAAAAFQFAMVEAALYDAGARVAVQTRVLAKTRLIERSVVVVSLQPSIDRELDINDDDTSAPEAAVKSNAPRDSRLRDWWAPVVEMSFDDPDQSQPVYVNNYVRAKLPWPRLWLGAYWTVKGEETSVYLAGPEKDRGEFFELLGNGLDDLLSKIPGATVQRGDNGAVRGLHVPARKGDFASEEAHRAWIIETLNDFVNAIRPAMKRLLAEHDIK